MTDDRDDEALRRAFADLRRQETGRLPSFRAVLEREPRRPPMALRAGALAAALVAASLAVGLLVRRPPPAAPMVRLAWTAPTDFLLRTPGIEFIESVPHLSPRRSLLILDGGAAELQSNRRSPSP